MKIFGVWHSSLLLEETLRQIDKHLDYKVPLKVMVELPTNYDELVTKKKARKGTFFDTIAETYRQRGSQIIYGDKELVLPDRPLDLVECLFPEYFFDSDERDEFMAAQMREKRPDAVILAVGHTEVIAPLFPHVEYIAFHNDLWGRYDRIRDPQARTMVRLRE